MNRANLSKDETEAFQGMFSLARAGLPVAAIYLDESFQPPDFQIEALDRIQSACVGPGRLAIVLPPKHGKTRLVQESVSWLIGNNPGKAITLVSDFEYGPKSVDIPLIRASQSVRERITGSMRCGTRPIGRRQ
jgi:transcription termination factor Rho